MHHKGYIYKENWFNQTWQQIDPYCNNTVACWFLIQLWKLHGNGRVIFYWWGGCAVMLIWSCSKCLADQSGCLVEYTCCTIDYQIRCRLIFSRSGFIESSLQRQCIYLKCNQIWAVSFLKTMNYILFLKSLSIKLWV